MNIASHFDGDLLATAFFVMCLCSMHVEFGHFCASHSDIMDKKKLTLIFEGCGFIETFRSFSVFFVFPVLLRIICLQREHL